MSRLSPEYGFFSRDSAFSDQKLGKPADAQEAQKGLDAKIAEALSPRVASKDSDLQNEVRDVLDWLDDANPEHQDFMDDLKAKLYRLLR